jgi:hypothetical protein
VRPPDGLCAKCRHELPAEYLRPELTRGTDICGMCALSKVHYLETNANYRKWISGWEAKLASLNRMASSYGVREHVRLQRLR